MTRPISTYYDSPFPEVDPRSPACITFQDNLCKLLNQHNCKDLIKRLSPELVVYFHQLMQRDPQAQCPDISQLQNFLTSLDNRLMSLVNEFDKARSSGKGLIGLLEQLALIAHHHTTYISYDDRKGYAEAEFLSSSMADREPAVGTILFLNDEPWRVDFSQEHGGAFVYILRSDQNKAIVVCRGTAGRRTASGACMSLYNDAIAQMGMIGTEKSWPSIREYFKQQPPLRTTVMGKSMGGCVAQLLSLLLEGSGITHVDALITVQSAGVTDEAHEILQKLYDEGHKFPIIAYRHARMASLPDDLVPKVGGFHLGRKCMGREFTPSYIRYDVGPNDNTPIVPVSIHRKPIVSAMILLRALGKTHVRQIRLSPAGFHLQSHVMIKPALTPGNERKLEKVRLLLAKTSSIFTCCFRGLRYTSFKPFYKREITRGLIQ